MSHNSFMMSVRQALACLLLCVSPAVGQRGAGELRLTVTDATGLGLEAAVELVGQATQVRQSLMTGPEGRYLVKALPFRSFLRFSGPPSRTGVRVADSGAAACMNLGWFGIGRS